MEHPRQHLWLTLALVSLASANWVYDWPYGARGECRCKSIEALSGKGFADSRTCREAFAKEDFEYCWFEDAGGDRLGGITERDCGQYAVTTHPSFTNMDCEVACLKVIVGSLSEAKFLQHCKLETVVEFDHAVAALQTGCFVNYVLGHADFNPTQAAGAAEGALRPLRIFSEVRTAAKCQTLCQQLDDCAWFQWRAIPDDECNAAKLESFQRPPQTCELYSYEYVNAVLDFDVGFFGHKRGTYASGVCDVQEFLDRGCTDLFKTSSWNPFRLHTKCLNCGCEQKCAFASRTHISGPAFCERGAATDVCSLKPPYEHSTPPPECSTVECEEATTEKESTTTTTTELATTRTRPPTQPVFTTTPESASAVTEGGTEAAFTEEGTPSTTYPPTQTVTEQSTTTELSTIETTTGLETMTTVSSVTEQERPCGPCPPCECAPGQADCECACPPCPCVDDACLDAHWEAQDFEV